MRAIISLIGGVVAIVVAILMTIMGADHVFTTIGGAIYFAIVIVLGVGGPLLIVVTWANLINK